MTTTPSGSFRANCGKPNTLPTQVGMPLPLPQGPPALPAPPSTCILHGEMKSCATTNSVARRVLPSTPVPAPIRPTFTAWRPIASMSISSKAVPICPARNASLSTPKYCSAYQQWGARPRHSTPKFRPSAVSMSALCNKGTITSTGKRMGRFANWPKTRPPCPKPTSSSTAWKSPKGFRPAQTLSPSLAADAPLCASSPWAKAPRYTVSQHGSIA